MGRIYNIYDHLSKEQEHYESTLAKYDIHHFGCLPDDKFTNALNGRYVHDEEVGEVARFDHYHPNYGNWFEHYTIGPPPKMECPLSFPLHTVKPSIPICEPPCGVPEPSSILLMVIAFSVAYIYSRSR